MFYCAVRKQIEIVANKRNFDFFDEYPLEV